jgi:hypothetical protein
MLVSAKLQNTIIVNENTAAIFISTFKKRSLLDTSNMKVLITTGILKYKNVISNSKFLC